MSLGAADPSVCATKWGSVASRGEKRAFLGELRRGIETLVV